MFSSRSFRGSARHAAAGILALALLATTATTAAAAGGSAPDVALTTTSPAAGQHGPVSDRDCSKGFDRAVRAYVDTTQRRDPRGFNSLLDEQVTIILANGGVLSGKKESAAFIRSFFADPGWTQTFHELRRAVDGCRSGFVLFDSVYSVPAKNRVSPLVIGVTFTYEHYRWLVLHNQDSDGPAS